MSTLLLTAGTILSGLGSIANAMQGWQSNGFQQQSLNESMRSNYYSYMQQLESMNNELSQDQLAIAQQNENIASNMNYMDRWASEYDLSMNNAVDETFSQYQQLAANYAGGMVGMGESGRKGGTAGMAVANAGLDLKAMNGDTGGFGLSGNRLSSYLKSSALDMISDRQTALSSIGTSYRAIDSYGNAMKGLNDSISRMAATTEDLKNKLNGEGYTV